VRARWDRSEQMKSEAEGQKFFPDRAEVSPRDSYCLRLFKNRTNQIYCSMYHGQSFSAIGHLGLK